MEGQFEAPFSETNSIDVFKLVEDPSSKVALLEKIMENFKQCISAFLENCSPQNNIT